MNPEFVKLALQLAAIAGKMVLEIKAQSGLTDDELLNLAEKNDEEARSAAKAFLESLK
jgi:hypothetical protein